MKTFEEQSENKEKNKFMQENNCYFFKNQCYSNYLIPEEDEERTMISRFYDKEQNNEEVAENLMQNSEIYQYNYILKMDPSQQVIFFEPEKLIIEDL